MKRLRGFDEIVSPENLWGAWRDLERGKRRRPDVALFGCDADAEVHELSPELESGTWRPGGYRVLRITDPKRRVIAAAPVRDRLVHHAVHRVLAPAWNRSFIDHSYACLPGRGTHRAVLRFRGLLRRHRYVMQLDVRRYFYSVDRARLRALLFARLPEPALRRLVDAILASGGELYRDPAIAAWLGWDEPGEAGRGLPIGNLTSQWWGNVYLDGLDHFACRELRVPAYQRYMDDFALFARDRRELVEARERIAHWLAERRGLELKDPAAPPRSTRAPHGYLGYRVTRDGVQLGPKARGRIVKRLRARLEDRERLASTLASYASGFCFGP